MILEVHNGYTRDAPWWQRIAEAVTDHADVLDGLSAEVRNMQTRLTMNDDLVKGILENVAGDLQATKKDVVESFSRKQQEMTELSHGMQRQIADLGRSEPPKKYTLTSKVR